MNILSRGFGAFGPEGASINVDIVEGRSRALLVGVSRRRNPPTLPDTLYLGDAPFTLLGDVTNSYHTGIRHKLFILLEEGIASAGIGQHTLVGLDGFAIDTWFSWALIESIAQEVPGIGSPIDLDFTSSPKFSSPETPPGSITIVSTMVEAGGEYEFSVDSGVQVAGSFSGARRSAILLTERRSGEIDVESISGTARWTGWVASLRTDYGPRVTLVGNDNSVTDGESGIPVIGEEMPTSGAVSIRSGDITQAQTASARTPESFTLGPVARGGLPYSDGFHSHELVVAASPEDMTRGVAFKPAAGFVAYPLHPGYANQTPGESVLSSAGTIKEGMQIKVPLGLGGVTVEWELVAGYATGRIASLGTVIDGPIALPGVELFDGSRWDDIAVTMQPDGSVGPVPDPFVFSPVTGAEPATQYESNAITIAGIPPATDIPVSVFGGQYSVSTDSGKTWGAWTSAPATVQLGYQIRVRRSSSDTGGATVSVTLNAGGRTGTFSITTKLAEAEPGVVITLSARNGSPAPDQGGITAVVRESITASDVLYQSNSASINNGQMTLSSPLIGNVGDRVCVTLLSADGKTGGLWPDAPVIDLTA